MVGFGMRLLKSGRLDFVIFKNFLDPKNIVIFRKSYCPLMAIVSGNGRRIRETAGTAFRQSEKNDCAHSLAGLILNEGDQS